MRGALIDMIWRKAFTRIIPADAGSTNILKSLNIPVLDHPRGCGEHGSLSSYNGKP